MYTNHKGWELKNVHIEIELIEEESNTIFNRQLQFEGNLLIRYKAGFYSRLRMPALYIKYLRIILQQKQHYSEGKLKYL